MQDGYGREIDYLRISITDKCNLRCKYCMPTDIDSVPMSRILSFEEIASVVREAACLGINRIKITGGEPLIRRNCCTLIKMLKQIDGISQVTITTNGLLLCEYIDELIDAGIDGINISIDTLDKERYKHLTGYDKLDLVLEGLDAVIKSGIACKINAVSVDWPEFYKSDMAERPMDYTCEDILTDANALIGFTKEIPVDVRFIEMMPIGSGRGFPGISHDVLIPAIMNRYKDMSVDRESHGNGPAVYYRLPGHKGGVGFISALHGEFCDNCNRIRLTTQGHLKSCLCFDSGINLRDIIRSSFSEEEKKSALRSDIKRAILCKPKSHCFMEEEKISEKHPMNSIGG